MIMQRLNEFIVVQSPEGGDHVTHPSSGVVGTTLPQPRAPRAPQVAEPPRLSPRAALIKKASPRLPHTAEGIPVGYYRADLLPNTETIAPLTPSATPITEAAPATLVAPDVGGADQEDAGSGTGDGTVGRNGQSPSTSQETGNANDANDANDGSSPQQTAAQTLALQEAQALHAAYVDLNFDYGYPTLPTGEPFWHKLDYEPGLEYGAFQIYLEADLDGPRELTVLAQNQELLQLYSLHKQAKLTPAALLLILNESAILYHWRARSRAYDLFKEAAYRHIRVKRQQKTEDYHYGVAEGLLQKVAQYLGTEKFINDLTPKVALDALKALVAIQRVSTGLPAAGPLSAKDAPESSEFEMILRQIGQKRATQAQSNKAGMPLHETGSSLADRLLEDPDTARMTQELVIRITKTSMGNAEDYVKGPGSRGRRRQRNNGRVYDQEGVDLSGVDDDSAGELDRSDVDFHKSMM